MSACTRFLGIRSLTQGFCARDLCLTIRVRLHSEPGILTLLQAHLKVLKSLKALLSLVASFPLSTLEENISRTPRLLALFTESPSRRGKA